MGLFKKAKEAAAEAEQAFAQRRPHSSRVTGWCTSRAPGMIDPAVMGGPSTRSVAADDPIWQPINGISLQDYAELARDAQARGINDEAGMITLAQERGWNPADTKAALDGCGPDGPMSPAARVLVDGLGDYCVSPRVHRVGP